MASVSSQLIQEVTEHAQSDSLGDAREICADDTYFPSNQSIIEGISYARFDQSIWPPFFLFYVRHLTVTLLHLLQILSNSPSSSFSSTTFQNLQCISDLCREITKFQSHNILLSRCKNLSLSCYTSSIFEQLLVFPNIVFLSFSRSKHPKTVYR